jgi:hypothetical protein
VSILKSVLQQDVLPELFRVRSVRLQLNGNQNIPRCIIVSVKGFCVEAGTREFDGLYFVVNT